MQATKSWSFRLFFCCCFLRKIHYRKIMCFLYNFCRSRISVAEWLLSDNVFCGCRFSSHFVCFEISSFSILIYVQYLLIFNFRYFRLPVHAQIIDYWIHFPYFFFFSILFSFRSDKERINQLVLRWLLTLDIVCRQCVFKIHENNRNQ